MADTIKFSQFPLAGTFATGDEFVGLSGGVNVRFNAISGGGGGGAVTQTITQPGHPFAVGNWVRVDITSGLYAFAQADSAENAETIGVVIERPDANTFVLQQSGYITSAQAVFAGLTTGEVQFLDTAVMGGMTNIDATLNGQVSRPVFVPDSPTSGWVVPYRPMIVGGAQPNSGGGGTDNTTLVTITQPGHGLQQGQFVRLSASKTYVTAQANTLANSQVVGVVAQFISVNQFVLQTAGYNVGAVTSDFAFAALVPAGVYYLSDTVPGRITLTPPSNPSSIVRPVYICEQIAGVGTVDAGYVLEQRSLSNAGATIQTITQPGHGFAVGDWLYISADSTYARGIATALNTSQVVGVVTAINPPNEFTLQTNGYVSGAVTLDGAGISVASAQVYYLSTTVAGRLQPTAPVTIGQITKPLYVQQTLGTRTGIILEQRPMPVTSAGAPGNLIQVQQVNKTDSSLINIAGWQAVPGLSLAITPSAITNQVFIFLKITISSDGSSGVAYKIQRNGVDIDIGNLMGARTRASGVGFGTIPAVDSGVTINEMFVDNPASVALQTYTVLVNRGNSAAVGVNQGVTDSNAAGTFRTTSNLILMEYQP